MNKKTLQDFIKVESKLKELQEQRDTLRAEIVKDMKKEKMDKAETDFGIFTVAKRVNWEYSPKVGELKEKVKLQEVKEQNQGIAEKSETEYLRFTNNKN